MLVYTNVFNKEFLEKLDRRFPLNGWLKQAKNPKLESRAVLTLEDKLRK